jgi:hypothetical protein
MAFFMTTLFVVEAHTSFSDKVSNKHHTNRYVCIIYLEEC